MRRSSARILLGLARPVDDPALAARLENAYGREVRVLGLSITEREAIVVALDDPPPCLEELRAVALHDVVAWRGGDVL